MQRLALFAVFASGCSLYFGGDDSDNSNTSPDATAPDPYTIERECIHEVIGGNLLLADDDEFFLTWRCEGTGVVLHVIERDGAAVPELEHADFQDQFRSFRLVTMGTGLPSVFAQFEHAAMAWIFDGGGARRYTAGRPFDDVFIGDLDGDGKRDIVLAGDNAIRRASGESTTYGFPLETRASDETELLSGKPFASVVRAPLGGSAAHDLFYATKTGELGVALQTAPNTFAIDTTVMDPGAPQQLQTADVDGDGIDDVIGAAGHLFVRSSRTGTIAFTTEPVQAFAIGDLDADGRKEPVYITADRNSVRRVTVQPNGTLTTEPVLAIHGGDRIAIGDLDGDHRGDVAIIYDVDQPTSRLRVHLAKTF